MIYLSLEKFKIPFVIRSQLWNFNYPSFLRVISVGGVDFKVLSIWGSTRSDAIFFFPLEFFQKVALSLLIPFKYSNCLILCSKYFSQLFFVVVLINFFSQVFSSLKERIWKIKGRTLMKAADQTKSNYDFRWILPCGKMRKISDASTFFLLFALCL